MLNKTKDLIIYHGFLQKLKFSRFRDALVRGTKRRESRCERKQKKRVKPKTRDILKVSKV